MNEKSKKTRCIDRILNMDMLIISSRKFRDSSRDSKFIINQFNNIISLSGKVRPNSQCLIRHDLSLASNEILQEQWHIMDRAMRVEPQVQSIRKR
jgi:hypothetical protein